MFGVIRIRVGFEDSPFEEDRRGICVHLVSLFFTVGVLCANVSNEGVDSGVYVFNVVFAHDLLVDDGRVLLLLRETCLKEDKL